MKVVFFLCALLTGCGLAPQRTSISDPEIQSLFSAAEEFPRLQNGFSPLPTDPKTDIRIERGNIGAYDVMLHIYARNSKTIAFRRSDQSYHWIHEQEIFKGPRFYDSPDGRLQEQIVLTYELKPMISGSKKDQLRIDYFGDDSRLSQLTQITLSDAQPILKEWENKK